MKPKMMDKVGSFFAFFCALLSVLITIFILVFIFYKGIRTFTVDKISVSHFLFSANWNMENQNGQAGALAFLLGSISVSLLALLLSLPLSLGLSIFAAEISRKIGENFLQPVVEMFAGIPSVVYGWMGLSILVPIIRKSFGGTGFSLLAGGIVLGIMIFPTITSISVDSLKALPPDLREASLALGATRWQTIKYVLLPAALPGILTGVVLGLARAFGEALAVQMVIGNSVRIPDSLINPVHTLTSILTMEMGNTIWGTLWNDALWSIALLLLMISLFFIGLIRFFAKRRVFR